MDSANGKLFDAALMREVKERFSFVNADFTGRERLYFDNAGGSYRLKSTVAKYAAIDGIPDCPERIHQVAKDLFELQQRGTADARLILNATGGSIYASLTASGAMFDMVRAIAEATPGTNMVTTVLEHPSSYDAMTEYAQQLGRELRVARSNQLTGGIDVDAIVELVDSNTSLLSVIYASNITGAKLDLEEIVKRARAVKPDLFIVVDAVQHAPHGLIDLDKSPVDGINFAPYKFFGCRGSGISWLSPRASKLPHHKLAAKPADFWDLGSAAPAQFAVITEIVDYVSWLGGKFSSATDRRALFAAGMKAIESHERGLLSRMLNGTSSVCGLRSQRRVKVFLDHHDLTRRDLILAIAFDDIAETDAVREYEKRGVIVYERVATSLYSKRMLESFGLKGAVRISPLHCNSPEDIDTFLRVTEEIVQAFSPKSAAR